MNAEFLTFLTEQRLLSPSQRRIPLRCGCIGMLVDFAPWTSLVRDKPYKIGKLETKGWKAMIHVLAPHLECRHWQRRDKTGYVFISIHVRYNQRYFERALEKQRVLQAFPCPTISPSSTSPSSASCLPTGADCSSPAAAEASTSSASLGEKAAG